MKSLDSGKQDVGLTGRFAVRASWQMKTMLLPEKRLVGSRPRFSGFDVLLNHRHLLRRHLLQYRFCFLVDAQSISFLW